MKIVVNTLTLLRLVATFFLPVLWRFCSSISVLGIVAIILLTDFFDGFLSRRFHVQSLFGSLADAISDKLFGIAIVLMIALNYPIFYFIVGMEILIALINVVAAFLGAKTQSSIIGKSKMWILGLATLCGIIAVFKTDMINSLNVEWIISLLEFFTLNEDIILIAVVGVTVGAEIIVAIDYAINLYKNKKGRIKFDFKDSESIKKVLFDTEYYLNNRNLSLSEHFMRS